MTRDDQTYDNSTDDGDFNDSDTTTVVEEKESPFKYYVEGERLREDGAYFELLLYRVVAQSGGLQEFDFVWPRAMKALAGLNTLRLSQFTDAELAAAMESAGPSFRTRIGGHASHIVPWADAFWRLCKIYGSFRQYLRSFDSEGPEALLSDLGDRLTGLSTEFLTSYLKVAGEKLQAPPTEASLGNTRRQGAETGGPRRGREGGGRRRGGRNGQQRQQQPQQQAQQSRQPEKATMPAQASAPAPAQTQSQEGEKQQKGGGGRRRGRRGFFRRKRGARGQKGPDSAGSSSGQAQP